MECLVPGCKKKAMSRGLCRNDYSVARYMINTGRVSENDLVLAGKMLPKKAPSGGGNISLARKWFEEAAKGEA
jgi:hypothetical protein